MGGDVTAKLVFLKLHVKWILAKETIVLISHSSHHTEVVAQLVRASDCGSEGRGFEPHLPPSLILNISFIDPFCLPLHKALKCFTFDHAESIPKIYVQ